MTLHRMLLTQLVLKRLLPQLAQRMKLMHLAKTAQLDPLLQSQLNRWLVLLLLVLVLLVLLLLRVLHMVWRQLRRLVLAQVL